MTRDAGRTAKLSIYGKNAPFSGNALERMFALIDEQQPGAGDEVSYRARHEYLSGAGQRRHASTDVNCYPADVVVDLFALARMNACTNIKSDRAHFIDDCARASDCARRAVECNEKPLPKRFHFIAAGALKFASYRRVMHVEQIMPSLVTQLRGQRGRAHDIGEQYSGKDTAAFCRASTSRRRFSATKSSALRRSASACSSCSVDRLSAAVVTVVGAFAIQAR